MAVSPTGATEMSEAMDRLPERLANWRRWLRYGSGGGGGRANSLEGGYRSKQSRIWHPPGPRPIEPKAADAWDITMAAITLPLRLHLVLKLKYVFEWEHWEIAEEFRREHVVVRCKTMDVEAIDWEAKCELLETLTMPIVIRRTRAVDKARRIIAKAEDMLVD